MHLSFFGAAGEVTGSCTLIDTGRTRVLVDCGMFQGGSDAFGRNTAPLPFDPATIDAIIMTHAHIDHIGRVPRLVKEGFAGRIFSTHPTRLLAKLMWHDAATVMKADARKYKREPMYRPRDLAPVFELCHGANYDRKVRIADDVSFRLREAGHIFGSSFVEIDAAGTRLVFSGDLGNDFVPILRSTEHIAEGDVVIMESTYGDRVHEDPEHRSEFLKRAVKDTVQKKGVLLIPAFSLERAQEILYELDGMVESGSLPRVPFYLDSPLAEKALAVYRQFPELYDKEAAALRRAGGDFFKFPGLRMTKRAEESIAIAESPNPKVIIAGSGMMHGGRIMHHLADYLNNPSTTVLIVGYQSVGTTGRAIAEGQKLVRVDHEYIEVRADIRIAPSYSAHADQNKLMRWVISGPRPPELVYLNHGDPAASATLAEKLEGAYKLDVRIPKIGDVFPH